jgi:hypothetical protein
MRIGIDADSMIRRIHSDDTALRRPKPGRQKRKQRNEEQKAERTAQHPREPPEAILQATKILDPCAHHATTPRPYETSRTFNQTQAGRHKARGLVFLANRLTGNESAIMRES